MNFEDARFYVELADDQAATQALAKAHDLISLRIGWETIVDARHNGNPNCIEVCVLHPGCHTPRHLILQFDAAISVTKDFCVLWRREWTFEDPSVPSLRWMMEDEAVDAAVYCYCGHYSSVAAAVFRGDQACLNPDCGRKLQFEPRHRRFLADYLSHHGAPDTHTLYTEVRELRQAERILRHGLPDPRVEDVTANKDNPVCVELATHWPRIETMASELAASTPAIMRITSGNVQVYLRN